MYILNEIHPKRQTGNYCAKAFHRVTGNRLAINETLQLVTIQSRALNNIPVKFQWKPFFCPLLDGSAISFSFKPAFLVLLDAAGFPVSSFFPTPLLWLFLTVVFSLNVRSKSSKVQLQRNSLSSWGCDFNNAQLLSFGEFVCYLSQTASLCWRQFQDCCAVEAIVNNNICLPNWSRFSRSGPKCRVGMKQIECKRRDQSRKSHTAK